MIKDPCNINFYRTGSAQKDFTYKIYIGTQKINKPESSLKLWIMGHLEFYNDYYNPSYYNSKHPDPSFDKYNPNNNYFFLTEKAVNRLKKFFEDSNIIFEVLDIIT